MILHLPIKCAYVTEEDYVIRDPGHYSKVTCEVCIAVVTTKRVSPDDHDDGRAAWDEATTERQRVRRTLYALGYESTNRSHFTFGDGLLTDYIEEFTGPLGSVLVDWTPPPQRVEGGREAGSKPAPV